MGNLGPTEIIIILLFVPCCILFYFVARFFAGVVKGTVKNVEKAANKLDSMAGSLENVAEKVTTLDFSSGEKEGSNSGLEQLERLAKLREQGHISSEEFEAQKRKLLG